MGLKYTDERILEDLKFIFKTYGNLRNPSIIDSYKNYGTVSLSVLDRKYKTKEATTYSPNNKDVWYHSYGLLVPVDDIIAECAASLFDSKIKYDDIKNELFGNNNPDENWDWFDDYFITF